VVVKNHHLKSVSTSPKKSAAQKFRTAGPFEPMLFVVGLTDIFA